MPSDLITFGPVHLRVRNLERSILFWVDLIGLQVRKNDDLLELGTDLTTLVVLQEVATQPVQRGFAGLYHLAIHLPTEADLTKVLARITTQKYRSSAIDHTLSKAVYLYDPDGIMVEITLETPERFHSYEEFAGAVFLRDVNGERRAISESLDVEALLSQFPNTEPEGTLPSATSIGHVHLHVRHLDEAVFFYQAIGFEPHFSSRQIGFADMSAGGPFPHRMALNTWQGRDATQAPGQHAGMDYFTIRLHSREQLLLVLGDFPDAIEATGGYFITDPSGNKILLLIVGS